MHAEIGKWGTATKNGKMKIRKWSNKSARMGHAAKTARGHPAPGENQSQTLVFLARGGTVPQTENILEEAHIGEEIWNTENWERMDRRYPHWDLDAWECPSPMDQRMKRNPFEFFAAIWSLAATSSIRPKSMVRTRMRNY